MTHVSSGRRGRHRGALAALSAAALAASSAVSTAATAGAAPLPAARAAAAPAASSPAAASPATASPAAASPATASSDVRELAPKARYSTAKLSKTTSSTGNPGAKKSAAKRSAAKRSAAGSRAQAAAGVTPPVGTTRTLVALDDYNGTLYKKPYTLQAVGDKIEVWVADDTSFPAGDCRAQVPDTTTVTTAQAQELAAQFDNNMFPKESAAFSVAPDRDGSNGQVDGIDASGSGDKIMTLVDNVRDDNYYEGVNDAPTYIAGFFSSQFNELLDRNVMTIDAFDWAHRTTRNPPNDPTGDACTSRPARPLLYEGTFAHEYQHLLEYYQDPAEVSWVNEGLSDFAESLVGYANAKRTVAQSNSQSHIYCYQGFGTVETPFNPNPRDCGGPENSLTLWGDQIDPDSILADYGEAWSFMLFLRDRYGLDFMSALHRDADGQGLVGLQDQLDAYADGAKAADVIHDFQTMTLVDRFVDSARGVVSGIASSRVTTPSLNSTVNLANPASYAGPGAPANGADYVKLRDADGTKVSGAKLQSLRFRGATTLEPQPLAWTSVADPPLHEGDPALWSGNDTNTDAGAVTTVTVPADNPTLSFDEYHLAELGYDYAYTVISTDGGKTYTSLANENTVSGPYGPALNGDAEGWATQTFDLSAYAGQSVVLGFRYVSDGGVNDGGWYVDDVTVGGTALNDGTTTEPFQSPTQLRPTDVYAWNVRVVGLDRTNHRARVIDLPRGSFSLSAKRLATLASYPEVVAIVAYDEPTEQYQPKALYTLTANGVVQPGGGQEGGSGT